MWSNFDDGTADGGIQWIRRYTHGYGGLADGGTMMLGGSDGTASIGGYGGHEIMAVLAKIRRYGGVGGYGVTVAAAVGGRQQADISRCGMYGVKWRYISMALGKPTAGSPKLLLFIAVIAVIIVIEPINSNWRWTRYNSFAMFLD